MGWHTRITRGWGLLLAAVAVAVFTATTGFDLLPALRGEDPQPPTGAAWPDGVIRYFNAAPEHDWALQQAVAAWNGSGVHVRFEPTDEQSAQLVIRSKDVEKCGHGHATLGFTPTARADIFRTGDGPGCDRFSAARVLGHELGHVLGLDHDDSRCAAMNSKGNRRGAERCPPAPPWQWRCRLLEDTDLLAAAKLYGGTPAAARGPGDCSLYASVQAPLAIRHVPELSTADHVAFSFVRPPDSVTPTFLNGFVIPAYTFTFVRGACGDRPESPRYRWSVAPGQPQTARFPILGTGVHCLRTWATDQMGRLSDTASTAQVDVQ